MHFYAEIVVLFCIITFVQSARILVIPVQGKSHMIATNAIGQELNNNGHEVYTLAEPYYKGQSNRIGANGLEILYYNISEETIYMDSEQVQQELVDGIVKGQNNFGSLSTVIDQGCHNMMADTEFMDKVSSLKFDLAIVEGVAFLPCNYLLPHILKIPHVTFLPGFFPTLIPGYAGLPSFSPPVLHIPSTMPMGFKDRLITTIMYILMSKQVFPLFGSLAGMFPEANDYSLLEHYREKGLVSDNIRYWMDFFDETQLFIIANADLTFDYPKPFYPNVISIEGLSVKEAKPLPKDVEALVQSSKHGVVVVSFGSNVDNLPDEIIIKLVNVFRKRKELFLMRYAGSLNENNFDIPKNVKFMSWLPQNDLLAHEKVKLFITHGGANGLHEAVYQGIPMLCVPLFGDQKGNAQKLQSKGFGLYFELTDYTEEEVLGKIEKIVSDPSYRKNTQKAGQIMRHRPMGARQTAAFWIEHVLKFGGEHLKPSSAQLSWWQYFCLDTLGFITLVVTFVFWLIFKILKFVLRQAMNCLFPRSHQKRE